MATEMDLEAYDIYRGGDGDGLGEISVRNGRMELFEKDGRLENQMNHLIVDVDDLDGEKLVK
jgi:hypothetical protein